MVFEENIICLGHMKHMKHMKLNFREDVVNAFRRRYDAGQTDRRDRSQQGHGRKGACKDAGAV